MAIQVLTKEVRELIAAGEVVERPASVVKELVENSIDAGAASIEIEIRGNGLKLIRVTDNGEGVERDDVPKAFLRHATSKVADAGDLDSIGTLGFRGEALAAISAVSKVRFVTKTKEAQNACEYCIEGGQEMHLSDTGAPDGTSVYVEDIFYNTPARMKFLKKDAYEGGAVQTIAEQLALSHPEIAFKFIREGRTVFATPGDGDLYSAVYNILPKDVASSMIKVSPASDKIPVWGYVSSPKNSRASRSLQYFFVNGRFVRSRSASAAAQEACKNVIMQGKYPSFVIAIEVPLDDVDVNVHPAKTEVRFNDEGEIFRAVYAAIKTAVAEYAGSFGRQTGRDAEPPKRETGEDKPAGSAVVRRDYTELLVENIAPEHKTPRGFMGYVPGEHKPSKNEIEQLEMEQPGPVYQTKNSGIDIEYTIPRKQLDDVPDDELLQRTISETRPSEHLILLGEAFETYIVAQLNDDMVFIDKHAAHERILFELLNTEEQGIDRQILIEPAVVSLGAEEKQAVTGNLDVLERIGFLVDDFGESEVVAREIPTYFVGKNINDAVTEIAVKLLENSNDVTTNEKEWLVHSTACRAAIKAGHKTSPGELMQLVVKILDDDVPKFCPHGRPVYFIMSRKEIEKKFGRQ